MSDQRRETRYPCHDPAVVQIVPGDGRHFRATVLDISRSGMRIELETPVHQGVVIQVALPKQAIIIAEVRHCRHSGDHYVAGVLINEVYTRHQVEGGHIHEDLLAQYLAGKGLKLSDVLSVAEHLQGCSLCRVHLHEPGSTL